MKRNKYLLPIVIVLIFLSCLAQKVNQNLQEFSQSFSSANSQLYGHLMLFGEYKGDLSTLTYDKYVVLLKQNEKFSTKNVAEIIRHSDQHFFEARRNTFLIIIYSTKLNAVIYDNASTSFCDSIKVLKENEPVPDLRGFIRKSR
jgi:hypothetical protein